MDFFQSFSPFSQSVVFAATSGILALVLAAIFRVIVGMKNAGTDAMQDIAAKIRLGAMAFLKREYSVILLYVFVAAILVYLFIDTGWAGVQNGDWAYPYTMAAFVIGAVSSMLAGFIGMRSAVSANVRTTQAARTNVRGALRIAFLSGATMGLSVVGIALIGLCLVFVWMLEPAGLEMRDALLVLTGYSFGASSVALFARVGGGIYTKAADVGADIVGKVEAGIPEDDPRNPAVIADNVGDNVGDVAGMGADLYGSYIDSLVAAMLLGLTVTWGELGAERAILYPLFVSALGIVASIIGTAVVRTGKLEGVVGALKNGIFVTTAIVLIGAYFIGYYWLPADVALGVYIALAAGLVMGVIISIQTEYYTSGKFKPVKKLSEATQTGPATTIIEGLALGYMSTVLPLLFIALTTAVAYMAAGIYGIAISAVGMLSTLGMTLAIDAYGPVADNAGGIAEMSKLSKQVRNVTDALDSAGNTTAAVGKGFAIASAALSALALLTAFNEAAQIDSIDIAKPYTFIGVMIGAMLPFLFCALTMRAVGRAAFSMIGEVRRQFREIKGIMEGKAEGDPAACVSIATNAAIREMIMPALIIIISPVAVGILLGSEALGGMLAGTLVTGILMAISMANSGGAWDNAKKFIEAGHLGGKGSDNHKAAVVGDTVGDPFKDTSGPSLNILVKLMSIIAVLTAGLYTATGLVG